MSLDKAIASGKEKRKPYRGAKAVDATCRNHGSDKWHEGNRRYKMRDKLTDVNESNYQCATCRWEPPSVFGGKPCFACDPDDPMLNCYERKEANDG